MHRSTAKKTKPQQLSFPDKLFYKIGEVSKIAGVEPYVLRYWETEFPLLKPRKSKSGQRIYVKKDLDMIFLIKDMLYGERLTIEGVRKRLSEANGHHKLFDAAEPMIAVAPPVEEMKAIISSDNALDLVKARLRDILNQLG